MVLVKKDLVFDPDRALSFDLYEPEHSNGKILVFWHGGGWIKGDKSDVVEIGEVAANAGFVAVIPNYRLAPRNIFPSAHEDSANFISWLIKSDYYSEAQEIVQIGASVGGTMALVLSMKYGFKTVTWSAPLNFSNWLSQHENIKASADAHLELGLDDPDAVHDSFYKYFVMSYLGPEATTTTQIKLDIQATYHNKIGKLLLFNSTHELVPLADTLNFVSLLGKSDLPISLKTIAGSRHAMGYSMDVLKESLAYLSTN